MTLRDRNVTELPPLSPGELDVLELLRADRDACGEGVTTLEIAAVPGTYLERAVRRLVAHGYVVGEMDGRFRLGHDEPVASTGASGDEGPGLSSGSLGTASGVPVDVTPRLFDPRLVEAA